MSRRAPAQAQFPPPPADFVRDGDYTDRFLSDAARAVPRAPVRVLESLWWYVTGRGVRARNRLQEIVGRRLGFARPNRLRPVPAPTVPVVRPRCVAIVPVTHATDEQTLAITLASIPDGIAPLVAAERGRALDGQIRVLTLDADEVAGLVHGAARVCDHDVLIVLEPGNVLRSGAAEALAAAFSAPEVEAVYADEVLALPGLTLPLLKPDFDQDLLLQVDFVGDFLAMRRTSFLDLGGYAAGREGGAARELLLRLSAARGPEAIGHVQGTIHGRDLRSVRPQDPSGALAASQTHLRATHVDAIAQRGPGGRIEIIRRLAEPPPVSVIVPTRDRLDLLVPCLDGLLQRTDYPDLEIVVADNDSAEPETLARLAAYSADPRVRIAPMPGPFNFSRINNEAVALARGRVLVFMNNDVEVLGPGWLRALVVEAIRPEIGAVGAKLLYPGGLIQHAGVVLGLIGGPAGHAFHLFKDGHPGYLHMLEATRRVSAVTAACLAVTRDKFEAMGGFDAEAFPVALNDVDLCLRLDAAGYRNLYAPKACLLHKESASRPSDVRPDQRARYDREVAAFTARWAARMARDPWYNPGHGQANADFSVPEWTEADWPPPPR